jgi:hypothetical protein
VDKETIIIAFRAAVLEGLFWMTAGLLLIYVFTDVPFLIASLMWLATLWTSIAIYSLGRVQFSSAYNAEILGQNMPRWYHGNRRNRGEDDHGTESKD